MYFSYINNIYWSKPSTTNQPFFNPEVILAYFQVKMNFIDSKQSKHSTYSSIICTEQSTLSTTGTKALSETVYLSQHTCPYPQPLHLLDTLSQKNSESWKFSRENIVEKMFHMRILEDNGNAHKKTTRGTK